MGLENSKLAGVHYINTPDDISIFIDNSDLSYNQLLLNDKLTILIKSHYIHYPYHYIYLDIPSKILNSKFIRNIKINIVFKKNNLKGEFKIFLNVNQSNIFINCENQKLNENIFSNDEIGTLYVRYSNDCSIKEILLKIESKLL